MRKRKPEPNATLEEVTWKDVRDNLYKVNQELTEIIDEIKPTDKMTLFRLRCPYGTELLRQGRLFLPDKYGNFLPLSEFPSDIRDKLGYNLDSNPAGVILDKAAELFLPLENRIITYGPIFKGKLFGLWRVLDNLDSSLQPIFLWHMTAGTRTLFMLPKITEAGSHFRMQRKAEISIDKPKTLSDHWYIFREIANREKVESNWLFDVIFFSWEWFKDLKSKKYSKLYTYTLKCAWEGSNFLRNQGFWNAVYSFIQNKREIKVPAYYSDIVKHIMTIAIGAVPGYAPAIDNEHAPISLIQKTYIEDYGLKKYLPIIMQPTFMDVYDKSRPVYYSLQFQTALELALKANERASTLTDLYIVQSILRKYIDEFLDNSLRLELTPVHYAAKNIAFDYFHPNVEGYTSIKETKLIFDGDKSFSDVLAKDKNAVFPEKSTFLTGCVRISHKKQIK